jgi:transportin-1
LLRFARLTPLDLSIDIENKQYENVYHSKETKALQEEKDQINDESVEIYNPNWTLRKCCSKMLDKLSYIYSIQVISILIPYLEVDLMSKDWITKERSILTLGAVGQGSYQYLKVTLEPIIKYLISELSNSNKFVRSIACWTLSRFTDHIFDNLGSVGDVLFLKYLEMVLKLFNDKESIVQEASMTSFMIMINSRKERLRQYLEEIFQICNESLSLHTGNSLLTLYDCICLLAEQYENEFKNLKGSQTLIINIFTKWHFLASSKTKFENYKVEDIQIYEVIIYLIKVSSESISLYCKEILMYSFKIIYENVKEPDLVIKCSNIISSICISFPELIQQFDSKQNICTLILLLIEHYKHDKQVKQFLYPLIADISRVDYTILNIEIEQINEFLISDMTLPENEKLDKETISLCNNSCWAIGVILITYREEVQKPIPLILEKNIKILSRPKLKKSLAQNVSICIGRIGLVRPEYVANYLEFFIKQFSLSLKATSNSQEKEEAF